jgi:hypothetical protein
MGKRVGNLGKGVIGVGKIRKGYMGGEHGDEGGEYGEGEYEDRVGNMWKGLWGWGWGR